MADAFGVSGGGGGGFASSGGGGGSTATSTTTQQFPVDMAEMIRQLQGQIGGLNTGQATQQNLNTFMNNPLSSELFTGTIGPILDQLRDSEGQSRQALADQFRMAGGGQGGALQSGAFANAATRNERDILANRSNIVANKASEVFRNTLSGLGLGLQAEEAQTTPARLGLGLLGAIRSTGTTETRSGSAYSGGGGGSSGWESIPQSRGLATPMMGDYMPSTQGPAYGPGSAVVGPNFDPLERYYEDQKLAALSNNYGGGGGYNVGMNPQTGFYESMPFSGLSAGDEY